MTRRVNHNIVDLTDIVLKWDTDKAILVLNLDDEKEWLPRSWIDNLEFYHLTKENGIQQRVCSFSIPEDLADKKGLI